MTRRFGGVCVLRSANRPTPRRNPAPDRKLPHFGPVCGPAGLVRVIAGTGPPAPEAFHNYVCRRRGAPGPRVRTHRPEPPTPASSQNFWRQHLVCCSSAARSDRLSDRARRGGETPRTGHHVPRSTCPTPVATRVEHRPHWHRCGRAHAESCAHRRARAHRAHGGVRSRAPPGGRAAHRASLAPVAAANPGNGAPRRRTPFH